MANIIFGECTGLADTVFGKYEAPIKSFIEKKAEAFEAESALDKLFVMEKSNNYAESFVSLGAMKGFEPVGEGGNYPSDSLEEGYKKTVEHMTWKNSFAITKEMVDDAKTMDLKKQPITFTNSFYRTRENFGAALFGAAISGKSNVAFGGKTFDTRSADGANLFSKEHTLKGNKSFKQSNMFADEFSNDALAAAECAMQDFRGEGKEILAIAPTTILIPNDYRLKKAVFEAIGADKDPATANNGFNYNFGRWNVIVWNYLNQFITNGSKPWILLDPRYNAENYGAVWLDRENLTVTPTLDANNDNNVWRGRARFTAAFNDWRAFCVGGIADGSTLISGT